MAAGTRDDRTTMAETMAMFARAPPLKLLWTVDGAGHVDLEGFYLRGLSRGMCWDSWALIKDRHVDLGLNPFAVSRVRQADRRRMDTSAAAAQAS